jgi:hypothetical protein
MDEHEVKAGRKGERVFLRQCSCGYEASASSDKAAIAAIRAHTHWMLVVVPAFEAAQRVA